MNKRYLIGFLILVLAFSWAGLANAVGIKVTPSEIKVEAKLGQVIEKNITIENPGQDVVLYEIYADDFLEWLKFKPASFILESKEIKNVQLGIKGKEPGIFLTTISVVAKPLSESGFKMNSGIKIPLEIIISQEDSKISMASISLFFSEQFSVTYLVGVAVVILLIYLVIVFFKRKKEFKNRFSRITK